MITLGGFIGDTEGATVVGPREFLAYLIKRAAKNETTDGNIVLKSIEDLLLPKCNALKVHCTKR